MCWPSRECSARPGRPRQRRRCRVRRHRPAFMPDLTSTSPSVYGRLINARGTFTIISGSTMLPEVRAAMDGAAQKYVHLDELTEAVGARLAALTGRRVGPRVERLLGWPDARHGGVRCGWEPRSARPAART